MTQPWTPSQTPPQAGFPSAFAHPRFAQAAPVAAPPVAPRALPVPVKAGRVAPVWLFAVLIVLVVALVAYFLVFIGPAASTVGAVLALLPLGGVLLAIRLVDRWEPEPRSLVWLALGWGAVASVVVALLVDTGLTLAFGAPESFFQDALGAVVRAPIVEELAKGAGVLLIFVIGRRAFDGPVDGIVYGALAGAGFAFTENIQYFAISLIEGGAAQATATFFVRAILSPFAHVMFTSVTGFALGLAARRGLSTSRALGPWALGLIGAMALHALWNASATFFDFLPLYLLVQVPLFVLFVFGVISLRREEARLTRARLSDYAAVGWFTPQEVEMLATPAGRRAGLAWARGLRGDRRPVMKEFIADATQLAAARQRLVSGRDPQAGFDEQALLARTVQARGALFAP